VAINPLPWQSKCNYQSIHCSRLRDEFLPVGKTFSRFFRLAFFENFRRNSYEDER
jgi:hypothetical protein